MQKYLVYNLATGAGSLDSFLASCSVTYSHTDYNINGIFLTLFEGTEQDIIDAIEKCQIFNLTDIIPPEFIQGLKEQKIAQITEAFTLAPTLGYTCSLGFTVDSNREDLKNYQDLAGYMIANSIAALPIRVNNGELRNTTLAELNTIINDLIGYGLYLYQQKWDKENSINTATTIEEILAISW